MKYYHSYMDRQEIPPELHEKLMNLDGPRKAPRHTRARYAALAACAVLVLGLGVWKGLGAAKPLPAPNSDSRQPAGCTHPPAETDAADRGGLRGFVVHSPAEGDKLMFPMVPAIAYQDTGSLPEIAASRAFAPGTFMVDLEFGDIQAIFWGPEGKPDSGHPKQEQGDLPWMLFWDGYTIRGTAWYDGQGNLSELTLYGEKDRAGFTLELRLGAMPFSCLVEPDCGDAVSEFNGVEVTGWSVVYDRDGDGRTDYICGSEFMTENNIGVRFKNANSPMQAEYGGDKDMELDGSRTFNSLFVRQALTGGLYLDHLMTNANIPAWRDETFDTLEQARREADFAPYLPTAEPEGYSACTGDKDFFARLSYQEGQQNMLFVRWSQGYDNVEVDVQFPEGDWSGACETVDISLPESYDTRLYGIPWYESVPEKYRAGFYDVTFRAEDMSLAAVEAREAPRDTGGVGFHFNVLHPNGVVVSYSCDGMTAQQVWEMVEGTLP